MPFEDILEPERVLVDIEGRSKKHVLEVLSELVAPDLDGLPAMRILNALVQRERLGCTSLGHGIALPHARIAGLDHIVGAFVRLIEPVAFDTDDGLPVGMIFGLLVPEDANGETEERLTRIAALFQDRHFCQALGMAESAEEAYRLLIEAGSPPAGLEASG